MSYHLKTKKRTNKKILGSFLTAFLVLFLVFILKLTLPNFLFSAVEPAATFFWNVKEKTLDSGFIASFRSKKALESDNKELRRKIDELESVEIQNKVLLLENNLLKEVWGRKVLSDTKLARVLVKPGQSPYDTIVIDLGRKDSLTLGTRVFAPGGILLGYVENVGNKVSVVRLLSDSKIKTDVTLARSGITLSLTGKGAGNFEVSLPKTTEVLVGDVVVSPDISPTPVARVEAIEVTEADSFQKLFLGIPVNIFELTWVEVLNNE